MKPLTHRTWKAQDVQAQRPLAFCRICGQELYWKMPGELCAACRAGLRRGAGK